MYLLFLRYLFPSFKIVHLGLQRIQVSFAGSHNQPSAVKDIALAEYEVYISISCLGSISKVY